MLEFRPFFLVSFACREVLEWKCPLLSIAPLLFEGLGFLNKKTWQYFSFVGIFFIPDVLFELSPKGRL